MPTMPAEPPELFSSCENSFSNASGSIPGQGTLAATRQSATIPNVKRIFFRSSAILKQFVNADSTVFSYLRNYSCV